MMAYQNCGSANGDTENRAILVASHFEFNVALLVDRVFGLRDARSWHQSESGELKEYRDDQGETWRKLDIAGLLQQAEFLQIGV
jgi:hypothetical protein